MKKFILFILTVSTCFMSIDAQDIAGIDWSMKMTESQVVSKFGKPEKFEQKDTDSGFHEIYHYCSDSFIIDYCDSYLDNFRVEKRGIAVLTKYIPGGIQVGDNISEVSSDDVNVRLSKFQSVKMTRYCITLLSKAWTPVHYMP